MINALVWFVVGIVLLIIGVLLGPELVAKPRPLVAVIFLILGVVIALIGVFGLLGVT